MGNTHFGAEAPDSAEPEKASSVPVVGGMESHSQPSSCSRMTPKTVANWLTSRNFITLVSRNSLRSWKLGKHGKSCHGSKPMVTMVPFLEMISESSLVFLEGIHRALKHGHIRHIFHRSQVVGEYPTSKCQGSAVLIRRSRSLIRLDLLLQGDRIWRTDGQLQVNATGQAKCKARFDTSTKFNLLPKTP